MAKKPEGLLEVTGSHVQWKCDKFSETVQEVALLLLVTTNRRYNYGLSRSSNSDDLE